MSTNLNLTIPIELKQYQLFLEEETDNCLMNDLLGIYLNNNESDDNIERIEYFSATGELLKRSLYESGSIKKEIFFINGRIGSEKEFDKNKVSEKKTYDKKGNIICKTHYIYRNNLVIGIVKKKNNNEYKISYSYDDCKRIINRAIYLNQELIRKQIYSYNNDNRITEYRDETQNIKICESSAQNELIKYIVTDICGNKLEVYNCIENGNYIKSEISLNEHKTVVKDENYVYNSILQKPQANEDDMNLVISTLHKSDNTNTRQENKIDIISDFINNNESNNILPINIRKYALVI